MNRILSFLIVLLVGNFTFSQVGISAGLSALKGFGPNKPWGGFNLGIEVPRDDQTSYYLRYTHHFSKRDIDSVPVYLAPRDITTIPPGQPLYPTISSIPSMNYNIFQFGTRYYIGSGYDFGWSGYGGTDFVLTFNKVKANHAPYDETLYRIEDYSVYEGSAFSLGFGLHGGVKYSVPPMGTVFFDVSIAYILLYQQNSNFMYNEMIQPLTFGFNLGVRKDILW
jgi:hypothetical protein